MAGVDQLNPSIIKDSTEVPAIAVGAAAGLDRAA
jgi:hypothetical protein